MHESEGSRPLYGLWKPICVILIYVVISTMSGCNEYIFLCKLFMEKSGYFDVCMVCMNSRNFGLEGPKEKKSEKE